jgi:hypothetical protein
VNCQHTRFVDANDAMAAFDSNADVVRSMEP